MADISGYYLPKFFNDSQDDPLMYDADLGILATVNNMPEGFISTTQVPDEINRCCGVDGVNRPRPGHDLIATIANCTRVNGICHFQNNIFIIAATVSGQPKWYSLNNTTLTDITTGFGVSPAFNVNNPVIMDQGLTAVYVCWGGAGLYKWSGVSWSTISIGTSPITSQPVIPAAVDYFAGSVTVTEVGTNVVYFSNLLNDASWDPINLSVQLDQFLQDNVTGMAPWQGFNIIVFKNTSVWSVASNPTLILTSPSISRANEPVNRISNTIGCCNHRTIAQIDNDILFLSESGRGVYSVGQIATNQQQAIKNNISLAIKGYIDRINWQAISVAYAVAWDDLYILHVPLDGATANNATLVYCVSLGTWQGIWNGYNSTAGCRQDSGNISNRYIYGDNAGNIFSHYHQQDQIYVDTIAGNLGTGIPYFSQITSRGYRFDQETNLIQPFNVVLELVNTLVPVTVQILADQNLVGSTHNIQPQSVAGSVLPVILPFVLAGAGVNKGAVSARDAGICSQIQAQISGNGQWEIIKISPSAWVSRGTINAS